MQEFTNYINELLKSLGIEKDRDSLSERLGAIVLKDIIATMLESVPPEQKTDLSEKLTKVATFEEMYQTLKNTKPAEEVQNIMSNSVQEVIYALFGEIGPELNEKQVTNLKNFLSQHTE